MIRRSEEPLSLKNESGSTSGATSHYGQRGTIIGAISQNQIGLSSHGVYRLPSGTGLLQHGSGGARILESNSLTLTKAQDTAIPLTTSYHQPSTAHHSSASYPGVTSTGGGSPAQGILHSGSSQSSTLHSPGPIPAHMSINQVQNQQIIQGSSEPVNLQTAHQQHVYHPNMAHQQMRQAHVGIGKLHSGTPIATPSPTGSAASPSASQPVGLSSNASAAAQQQQFQRLKVEDALSYLDQVKYKFGGQPQVYNDFLDIMKEFKSQSIDTPGVIARVSSLFRGHPELIVGFNTFLPPGYKIEVKSSNHMATTASGGALNNLHTTTVVHAPSGIHHISASGAITYPVPQVERQSVNYVAALVERGAATPPISLNRPVVAPTPPMSVKPAVPSPGMTVTANQYHSPTPPSSVGPPVPPVAQTPPPSQLTISQQATLQGTLSALAEGSVQPVEFNHAISYVNKIKSRFHGQPDIYKQFLEILHTYKKEQKMIKEGIQPPPGSRFLTEQEVYSQVARLFHHQEDLLAEFGQFLPDATSSVAIAISHRNMLCDQAAAHQKKAPTPVTLTQPSVQSPVSNKPPAVQQPIQNKEPVVQGGTPSAIKSAPKRPLEPSPQGALPKKPKIMPASSDVIQDISIAEAAKYGSLSEFAFFDKVRRALKSPDVYENFLRCLLLFNQELISRGELVQLVTSFLGKFPDLLKWFRDFLGLNDSLNETSVTEDSNGEKVVSSLGPVDLLPSSVAKQEKLTAEKALEIDYSTCKRLGASYCALPRSHVQPKCSGRTALCKEVLNDTWVSFPSWSEDSTFVSSRKTQYEEYIYRCEDERFEMDVVLEANLATIRVLEMVQKKMARMTPEEVARFKLDDSLGGSSPTIHIRAIKRIYGEKATDIIEGLKRNPSVAVPVVLRRLKTKEEEWREAQKGFNKIWREQNEKYYLKSLDHQGITFKQNDMKLLRTKSLLNEIETLYEERQEQAETGGGGSLRSNGPHMILPYSDRTILDDAAELLIYHAKRASIQKEEKKKIKILVKHTLPDIFMHQRQELSEDERDEDDEEEENTGRNSPFVSKSGRKGNSVKQPPDPQLGNGRSKSSNGEINGVVKEEKIVNGEVKSEPTSRGSSPISHTSGIDYTLLVGNSAWYAFMRLHQILCERLSKMKSIASQLASDYKEGKEIPASIVLKMRPTICLSPPEYYGGLIDMVKNLLDNNLDSSNFEDQSREIFGIHAYPSFTLDKVVINAVRQLQHIVSEETSIQCTECFFQFLKQRLIQPRHVAEAAYQTKCEALITEDNVFKMYIHQGLNQLTIELLDTDSSDISEKSETKKSREKWQNYVDSYSQGASVGIGEFSYVPDSPEVGAKPIFLRRNTRHWRKLKDKIKKEKLESDEPERKLDLMEERPELRGLVVNDNTKCKFSPNRYKLAFVVKSGSFMYRKGSLHRARRSHRRVILDRHDKFSAWHASWRENHVLNPESAQSWFNGQFDGSVPNATKMIIINRLYEPPYVPYAKYIVNYPVEIVTSSS